MTTVKTEVKGDCLDAAADGRRLRADARANRQRILEAAAEVFAAEGAGAPIDDVARRACVGVGTVYRHFPTKEALIEAIVVGHLRGLLESAERLADAADPAAAIDELLGEVVETMYSKRDLAETLTAAGIDVKERASGLIEELQASVGRLMERAQQAGTIRGDVDAVELFSLVSGVCTACEHSGSDIDGTKRLLTIVFDGLRTNT